VEVAQYKATLASYNVPEPVTAFLSLHVRTINTRQVLLDVANGRIQQSTPQKEVVDHHPVEEAEIDNLNLAAFLPGLDDIESSEDPPLDAAPPLPAYNDTDGHMLKKYGAFSHFRQFQASILDRKWLPIGSPQQIRQLQSGSMAQTLLADNNSNEAKSPASAQSAMADSIKNHRTSSPRLPPPTIMVAVIDGQEKEVPIETNQAERSTQMAEMEQIPSFSPANGNDHDMYTQEAMATNGNGTTHERRRSSGLMQRFKDKDKEEIKKGCMVSHEWVREYAWFLYEKYIKDDSDLAINVSGEVREFLMNFFALPEETMCAYVVQHSGGLEDESKELPAGVDEHVLVNTYLYHLYDQAFEEVWTLLQSDSFIRFTMTAAYQKLVEAEAKAQEADDPEAIGNLNLAAFLPDDEEEIP